MQTLFVPVILAAMVAAWLPAQISAAAQELGSAGCVLSLARQAPELIVPPEDACRVLAGMPGAKHQDVLASLVQWQSISDL